MAGKGPLPKEQTQRERNSRRRDGGASVVYADDVVRGPEIEADRFSPQTLAWYKTWRRSPQAQLFESTDWLTLQLLAPLVEAQQRRPSASAAAEIRLTQERFGATVADRIRLRMRIQHEDAEIIPFQDGRAGRRAEAIALLRSGDECLATAATAQQPAPF